MVAVVTVGESEFWVLILEEGRVSFRFRGRRCYCVRREERFVPYLVLTCIWLGKNYIYF